MNRPFTQALVLVLAISIAVDGIADSASPIVVLVKGEKWEALTERICKELTALGLDAWPAAQTVGEHSEASTENIRTVFG